MPIGGAAKEFKEEGGEDGEQMASDASLLVGREGGEPSRQGAKEGLRAKQ